jgi:uncharacterized pyridoxamine 5'-phosphate oxidase family protein
MAEASGPTPIDLENETIREAVDHALEQGKPIVVAYVDDQGQPRLSFRGSTQVYGKDQLAIWVRNPEGGLQRAIKNNPRVSLLYRSPEPRMNLNIMGRAHFESSEDVRKKVYESSPQSEQNADRDRKGMALVIDVDRVNGVAPGMPINMQR